MDIPEDVISESFRYMMAGAGFEPVGMDEYRAAVQEVILALQHRGWKISPRPCPFRCDVELDPGLIGREIDLGPTR